MHRKPFQKNSEQKQRFSQKGNPIFCIIPLLKRLIHLSFRHKPFWVAFVKPWKKVCLSQQSCVKFLTKMHWSCSNKHLTMKQSVVRVICVAWQKSKRVILCTLAVFALLLITGSRYTSIKWTTPSKDTSDSFTPRTGTTNSTPEWVQTFHVQKVPFSKVKTPIVFYSYYRSTFFSKCLESLALNAKDIDESTPCIFVLYRTEIGTEKNVSDTLQAIETVNFCKKIVWQINKNEPPAVLSAANYKRIWWKTTRMIFEREGECISSVIIRLICSHHITKHLRFDYKTVLTCRNNHAQSLSCNHSRTKSQNFKPKNAARIGN